MISGHSILYTWDKLTEKKSFIWWAEGEYDKKRTTDLTEVIIDFFINSDKGGISKKKDKGGTGINCLWW